MEPVFVSVALLVGAMFIVARWVQNGVGGMSSSLHALGHFLLVKAPAGAVDLFDDSAGRGGRTWVRFGMVWMILATTLAFVARWHRWDGTALDSLASLGWSYDDGSGLGATVALSLRTGLVMIFIGTALTAAARASTGRLASEANASLMALVFALLSLVVLLLPTIANIAGLDVATEDLLIKTVSSVALHSIVGAALLVNALMTIAGRGEAPVSYSGWFLIDALVVMVVAPVLFIVGELGGATQTVWFAQAALEGWLPLALMLATAYAVVPAMAQRAVWSSGLASASLLLLFATVPVIGARSVDAAPMLQNLAAILLTLGLLPLMATSVNLLQTARAGATNIASSPAGVAAVMALLLLPIFAVGTYFAAMETMVGTGSLALLSAALSRDLLFTVGGLFALASVLGYMPHASGRSAADSGGASTAVWMVGLGGLLATISTTLAALSARAVTNAVSDEDVIEAVMANLAGFELVGAFLFYGVALGFMIAGVTAVRIGFSPSSSSSNTRTDVSTYALSGGQTSIRALLGRGLGMDTVLLVGAEEEAVSGSTVIAVRADLHADEVKEFPEVEEGFPEELHMLAGYLAETGQDVFSFFRSIDLDDSGAVDGRELQKALRNADIANLPPWDMGRLLNAVDLDGDGQINLPELDIVLARLRQSSLEEE